MSIRFLRGCVNAALAAAGAAGLIYVLQLGPYWRVQDARSSQLAELQKQIQQGLIMEAQYPQFRQEVAKLEEKLAVLDRVLPPEPDLVQFRRSAMDRAAEEGVPLSFVGEPSQIRRQDGAVAVSHVALLCGPVEDAEELLGLLCRQAPTISVHDVTQEGSCTRARLVVHGRAWTPDPPAPLADCSGDVPRSPLPLLLPPLGSRDADMRRRIEEACEEAARLEGISTEVMAFLRDRSELERRNGVVDGIVAEVSKTSYCHPPE